MMRLRKTPEVSYANGLSMVLQQSGAPRFLACPNQTARQLVLFDLLVDGAAGIPVAQLEQSLITAAVSANGDSLCLGGSGGGLWVYDTAALVAAAVAGCAGEPTQLVRHRAQNAQPNCFFYLK